MRNNIEIAIETVLVEAPTNTARSCSKLVESMECFAFTGLGN